MQEQTIYQKGNSELLKRDTTAFFCSRRAPNMCVDAILQWISRLSIDNDCILCGNHSYMEQVVFAKLLQHRIPTILVLAESIEQQWKQGIQQALNEDRLLIITHCDDSVHAVSKESACDRNKLMLSLARQVVVGYCTKGGNIAKQIAGLNNVTVISPSDTGNTDHRDKPTLPLSPIDKVFHYLGTIIKEKVNRLAYKRIFHKKG